MSPFEPAGLAILAAACAASAFSAAFAFGGVYFLLAVMPVFVPIHAVLPIQSAILLGAQVSRGWLFRQHVQWRIVWPFSMGCAIGAFAGARVYLSLPELVISLAIAALMLFTAWMPRIPWRPRLPHPYFVVGIVHAFLSTVFAIGGLLQPVIFQTNLDRQAITGTIAGAMFGMSLFKVAGYITFGFDIRPYLGLIAACWLAAYPSALVGRHFLKRMPEKRFRLGYRILLTAFALRLVYTAVR